MTNKLVGKVSVDLANFYNGGTLVSLGRTF